MTIFSTSKSAFLSMAFFFAALTVFTSCSSDDGHPRLASYEEKTVHESTKGVESEVEEQEPGGEYLILDERIIDEKEDSRAIVHNLDGTIDTLSFAQLDSPEYNGRHSALRGVLIYGVARSFFTRNMNNVTPDPRYYKDRNAFNKSVGVKNDMMASSRTRTVKAPKGAASGYGRGKSFRSFGG